MPQTRELIETALAFDRGDGPVPATCYAEHTDRREAALHISPGYDKASDPVTVYLDPVGATQLAAQLLAAARQAQTGRAPRNG